MKLLAVLLLSILVVAVLADGKKDSKESVETEDYVDSKESTDKEPAQAILPVISVPQTYHDRIAIGSPVAWYPTMLDITIGYFANWVRHQIGLYKIVKERLLHHKQLLQQIPPFYDSINLFYDGDHLRSVLSGRSSMDEYEPLERSLNYTVPRPKMALEVIDTVKTIMDSLKVVKH